MAAFDGTAAKKALDEGKVVAAPGATIADRIVSKAELGLTSAQVIVGGIGSGKTTQLMLAEQRLGQMDGVVPIYVESLVQNEEDSVHGGLITMSFLHAQPSLFGEGRYKLPPEKLKELKFVNSPRIYSALKSYSRQARQEMLSAGIQRFSASKKRLVLLVDSLDRLDSLERINEVIEEEVPLFKDVGVSIVMVAPQRLMYGPQRSMLDRFDEVYHQPFVDVGNGQQGRAFLLEVLRRRATPEILPDASCQALVAKCGGVLRDLILLARSAGENAYVSGKGSIEPGHVEAAADGMGRRKLLHLSREQIAVLQRVRQKGSFVQVSEQDLTLVLTGCVLEYQKLSGAPHYEVHPTIRPLLEQIAEEG